MTLCSDCSFAFFIIACVNLDVSLVIFTSNVERLDLLSLSKKVHSAYQDIHRIFHNSFSHKATHNAIQTLESLVNIETELGKFTSSPCHSFLWRAFRFPSPI